MPGRLKVVSVPPFQEADVLLLSSFILLMIAATGPAPWFGWGALQLVVLGQIVLDRDRTSLKNSFRRSGPQLLASTLLGIGFWVGLSSSDRTIHEVGVILTIVGVGGLIGWFPLPLGRSRNVVRERISDQVATTLIPVVIAALLLFRCVQQGGWSEAELATLAVVSLFTLALCGVRLHGELSIERRCRLATLTILSNAGIAIVLSGWELLHPDRNWAGTSNLPTGAELFVSILVVESLAALVMLVSFQAVFQNNDVPHLESSLTGIFHRSPVLTTSILFGVFTLAGLPPLAGAWWRFALLSSLLMPQERSVVTGLSEPHHGFVALAVAYAGIVLIVAVGQMRLFHVIVADPSAESSQDSMRPARLTIISICVALLILVSLVPVSFLALWHF